MELGCQLLNIASKKIAQKPHEYGITYEIEQSRAYLDSLMSIWVENLRKYQKPNVLGDRSCQSLLQNYGN